MLAGERRRMLAAGVCGICEQKKAQRAEAGQRSNCGVDHACNPPRDWARFFFYTCVSLHPMEVDYNPCLSAMCHVDEAERPLPHGSMTPQ